MQERQKKRSDNSKLKETGHGKLKKKKGKNKKPRHVETFKTPSIGASVRDKPKGVNEKKVKKRDEILHSTPQNRGMVC